MRSHLVQHFPLKYKTCRQPRFRHCIQIHPLSLEWTWGETMWLSFYTPLSGDIFPNPVRTSVDSIRDIQKYHVHILNSMYKQINATYSKWYCIHPKVPNNTSILCISFPFLLCVHTLTIWPWTYFMTMYLVNIHFLNKADSRPRRSRGNVLA